MSYEEKKAIEDLKDNIEYAKKCMREDTYTNQETIYIVLNLIEKQQNTIKAMAKELTNLLEATEEDIIKQFTKGRGL